MVRRFEDLEVWKLSVEIIRKVYILVATFPKEEKFSLVIQIKEAVVSIAGNIAEGFGRFHYRDKIKFYYNARGSLYETKSHLIIAETLGFINKNNRALYQEIMRDIEREAVKLNNFISAVG